MITKNRTMAGERDSRVAAMPHLFARITAHPGARGLVVFVRSSEDDVVQTALQRVAKTNHFATCLIDLCASSRQSLPGQTVDGEQISDRLECVLAWISLHHEVSHLPVTLYVTGTIAAAAVRVAARAPELVSALVCHCGQLQGEEEALSVLEVPTLLVTPADDIAQLMAQHEAFLALSCTSQLAVIRDTNCMYEEPEALAACQHAICNWIQRHAFRQRGLTAPQVLRADDMPQAIAG